MSTHRTAVLAVLSLGLLFSSAAFAQEGSAWSHGEVSVQGTGFFTKDSSGNGISQHSTDTGGFLVGYRYHFNRWLAAEANYGYDRNTQQNFTAGGPFNVQANVHHATAAAVVTLPGSNRINPYVLAGAGALVFDPTNNAWPVCGRSPHPSQSRHSSMAAVSTSRWSNTLPFAPSIAATSTTGPTSNWLR